MINLLAVTFLVWFGIKSIYRLHWHPLCHIPGPKCAAISHLYEFYYDVVKGGTYLFEVQKMHRKYGPIVRINPREVHIADPDFYDDIYSSAARTRWKDPKQVPMIGAPFSMGATWHHDHHKFRRGLIKNHFSRQSIDSISPKIRQKVEKFCDRLEEASNSARPVNLSDAFAALTSDIIAGYAFDIELEFLSDPQFKNDVYRSALELDMLCHVLKFFPFILRPVRWLPSQLTIFLGLENKSLRSLQDIIDKQIISKSSQTDLCEKNENHTTENIFTSLCNPRVPAEERTLERLRDESLVLLIAGAEATARALAVFAYYAATGSICLDRLRKELREVLPDSKSHASWPQLEHLPYLKGVVNESLRLSFGAVGRLSRMAPTEDLHYKGIKIPKKTPMSSSAYLIHMNSDVFPEPERFAPDRWLKAAASGINLQRYLVAFSRGTRQCIGINLAQCQLYFTIAAVAQRFDFELFDTKLEDIQVARDYITAFPRKGLFDVKCTIRSSTVE